MTIFAEYIMRSGVYRSALRFPVAIFLRTGFSSGLAITAHEHEFHDDGTLFVRKWILSDLEGMMPRKIESKMSIQDFIEGKFVDEHTQFLNHWHERIPIKIFRPKPPQDLYLRYVARQDNNANTEYYYETRVNFLWNCFCTRTLAIAYSVYPRNLALALMSTEDPKLYNQWKCWDQNILRFVPKYGIIPELAINWRKCIV